MFGFTLSPAVQSRVTAWQTEINAQIPSILQGQTGGLYNFTVSPVESDLSWQMEVVLRSHPLLAKYSHPPLLIESGVEQTVTGQVTSGLVIRGTDYKRLLAVGWSLDTCRMYAYRFNLTSVGTGIWVRPLVDDVWQEISDGDEW